MIAGVSKKGLPKSLAGVTLNGRGIDFHAVGGSSLAGPMWAKAMHIIQNYLSPVNFDPPPERQPAPPKAKKDKKAAGPGGTGGTQPGGGLGQGGDGHGH